MMERSKKRLSKERKGGIPKGGPNGDKGSSLGHDGPNSHNY